LGRFALKAHGMVTGFGIGLRSPFAQELLGTTRSLDWLEITPENWMFYGGKKRRLLAELAERFPVIPHSVSLNLGGIDPLDVPFLEGLRSLTQELQSPLFSDHICFSSIEGRPLHELLPLPFTDEAVEVVGQRSRETSRHVEQPLVLENASFYAHMPSDGCMTEAQFVSACLESSGAQLLLDVNNVYVNAQNHGSDAHAFLDAMPMDQVAYVHLAGHTRQKDVVIDTHIGPIPDTVWELYRYALARAGRLLPTLIEWDQDVPVLDVVLDEVDRAREHAAMALRKPL
jgi:uncharacterized protein (UPF0276 family)